MSVGVKARRARETMAWPGFVAEAPVCRRPRHHHVLLGGREATACVCVRARTRARGGGAQAGAASFKIGP